MAFCNMSAITVGESLSELNSNPTVVELGNQRFQVNRSSIIHEVKDISKKLGFNINTENLNNLFDLDNLVDEDPNTELFYKSIGFTHYDAIDLNGKYGNLLMDLNFNLKEKYQFEEKYDLVTNIGTGEHIFNQHAVFENMHNLCKKDGLMFHLMPFVNWLNHGFYNFHPILYFDIANANNYKIVDFKICTHQGKFVNVNLDGQNYNNLMNSAFSYDEPTGYIKRLPIIKGNLRILVKKLLNFYKSIKYKTFLKISPRKESINIAEVVATIKNFKGDSDLMIALSQLAKDYSDIMVSVVMKKTTNEGFKTPAQGKYINDISSEELKSVYGEN